jgi:hypothetical protein
MKTFHINEKVNDIDLNDLYKYTKWSPFERYFKLDMGKEHYKLLAFLSKQCEDGDTIYDIGTFQGYSALALSYNSKVNVVTYDLVNHITTVLPSPKDVQNIQFKIADCTNANELKELAKAPLIFLDVDPHDGVQEPQIFTALQNAGFRGILLLDDIHLNEGMRKFWDWVPLKKYDITKYGHFSGTGLVVFDESQYNVEINM